MNMNKKENAKLIQALKKTDENGSMLIENLINEYNLIELFGNSIISRFKAYSNDDYETFKIFFEKLYYSFKQVQKESGLYIELENQVKENQDQLTRTFANVVRQEKNGSIKTSFSSYLFTSFLNTFRNLAKNYKSNQNNNNAVPMINFLEE